MEDAGREAALFELFGSPCCVFEDVVENGDNPFFFGVDARHDPERVQNVGFTVSALLSGVGLGGDLNGGVE